MRTGLALVAAALLACGGDETTRPRTVDAGDREPDASAPADAGKPDAGSQGGAGAPAEPNEVGGEGGSEVGGEVPTGGMAAGGSGGKPNPPPEGGAGAGGAAASQERVLWSKEFTVSVHEPLGYDAHEGDQMGLRIETDRFGCTVGDEAQPSGSTREFLMDASCLTTFARTTPLTWAVLFYRAEGEASGLVKREELDWSDVDGKTVTKLRRTQTWSLDRLCETSTKCWNYANFTGKWEVIGY